MHLIHVILAAISFLNVAWGQYESPNYLCGGWLRGTNGSIQYTAVTADEQEHKVCVWTVSPMLPSQRNAFSIDISLDVGQSCDSSSLVSITHFVDRQTTIGNTETWSCTQGPQSWVAVPGTLFVVVFKSNESPRRGNGFTLKWREEGDWLGRNGVRTMYTSWGASYVEPYFAGGFFTNEIATYAFPKGNDTKGYKLEMNFQRLQLDQCNSTISPCVNNTIFIVNKINLDGKLSIDRVFDKDMDKENPYTVSSEWGIFLLAWVGDFWGAGGSFQLDYKSVRA